MEKIYLFILILFGIFYGLLILYIISKDRSWSINLWTHAWLYVLYIVIPCIVISRYMYGDPVGIGYDNITLVHGYYFDLYSLLCIVVFVISYSFITSIRMSKGQVFYAREIYFKINGYKFSVLRSLVLFSFLFSLVSLFLYTLPSGGIVSTAKAAHVRQSITGHGVLTIFQRFIPLSIYILLLAPFLAKKIRNYFVVVACCVMIIYSFLEPQRQVMLFYVLVPVFGFLILQKKVLTKKMVIVTIVIIGIFPYIHFLNKAKVYDRENLQVYVSDINFDKYIREFSFPYIAVYMAQNSSYDHLYLDDFWLGVFGNWLPSSFVKKARPSNALNSYFFMGKEETSVPPGIIANSFYHLGLFGAVLWGVLLGITVKSTDIIMATLCRKNILYAFCYSFFFWVFFALIRTGVPGFSLYKPFFLFLLIILVVSHKFFVVKQSLVNQSP